MIRVISKQLVLALTVLSFSLSPTYVFAEGDKTEPAAGSGGGTPPAGLDTSKGGPTGNDSAEKKLDDAPMENAIQALNNAKAMSGTMVTPTYELITKEYAEYTPTKKNCVSRHAGAANACLEHLSPNILTGITSLNTILSMLGGAAVKDQCSGFANAMDIAKAAMTAYTAACGAMKAGCGLSCVGARKGLEKMQKAKSGQATCPDPNDATCPGAAKAYNIALESLNGAAAKELVPGQEESMAGKAKLCTEKYANLLTSGLAGIASLLNSIKQGKKCEDESKGSTTNPAVADICADPAKAKTEECLCKNPQSPECICFKNPRTAGCSTGIAGLGETSTGGQIATGATDKTNVSASGGVPNLGDGTGGMELGERNPSSADGAGAPTGGGAGGSLGGSSGGSGGGAGKGEESAAKKGLDTNILGGAGGGGGGGSWGSYGGSGSSEKYRAYLPGGAKDPNKAGGQGAWTKEVSGQGGKSNWDKIKERYRDNRNTLLNN